MENKQFAVVSNNRVYMCATIDELKTKTEALNQFEIPFTVYYSNKNEWTKMLISVHDLLKAFNKGLKDGLGVWYVVF